jgi:hypothetical protein
MERPVCKTCFYSGVYANRRICERHAPRPEMIHDDVQTPDKSAHWPLVHDLDRCGEHPDYIAWIEFHKSNQPTSTTGAPPT